jgi:DNA-binding beta-propeller fold protein YncE
VGVISGTDLLTFIPAGVWPGAVGVNPTTGYVYVGDTDDGRITVLSATSVITTLAGEDYIYAIGVNPTTGYVYAIQPGTSVRVLSGTQSIVTLATNGSGPVGVNSRTGYVYLSDGSILSATEVVTRINLGGFARAIGVNEATGYAYFVPCMRYDYGYTCDHISIVSDTAVISNVLLSLATSNARVAASPATGYVYVVSWSDTFGSSRMKILTNTTVITTVELGYDKSPFTIAANPQSGYVYLVSQRTNSVSVWYGTQNLETLPVGGSPDSIGINPGSGLVYVLNVGGQTISVISENVIYRIFLPLVVKNR